MLYLVNGNVGLVAAFQEMMDSLRKLFGGGQRNQIFGVFTNFSSQNLRPWSSL
jgi:hypothetical protein